MNYWFQSRLKIFRFTWRPWRLGGENNFGVFMKFCLAVYTLWRRELVRFYRQPSRVVGAVGTALLFWAVLGTGIGGSQYRAYFFPGTIVMSVMFTCIFSTASIIEDRQSGF